MLRPSFAGDGSARGHSQIDWEELHDTAQDHESAGSQVDKSAVGRDILASILAQFEAIGSIEVSFEEARLVVTYNASEKSMVAFEKWDERVFVIATLFISKVWVCDVVDLRELPRCRQTSS